MYKHTFAIILVATAFFFLIKVYGHVWALTGQAHLDQPGETRYGLQGPFVGNGDGAAQAIVFWSGNSNSKNYDHTTDGQYGSYIRTSDADSLHYQY